MLFALSHILLSVLFLLLLFNMPQGTQLRLRGITAVLTVALVAMLLVTALPVVPQAFSDSPVTFGITVLLGISVVTAHFIVRKQTRTR